jgi:hypothetical protein
MCPSAAAERERKRRKKNGAAGEVGTMDPLLWGRLPEDLVDKLVQYLPVPALLRARAVCRRLRDFVFSDKFQEARACVPAWSYLSNKETPYLLVFVTIEGHRLCSAYDAVADVWRRMPPMPGLPSRAKDCVAGPSSSLSHSPSHNNPSSVPFLTDNHSLLFCLFFSSLCSLKPCSTFDGNA